MGGISKYGGDYICGDFIKTMWGEAHSRTGCIYSLGFVVRGSVSKYTMNSDEIGGLNTHTRWGGLPGIRWGIRLGRGVEEGVGTVGPVGEEGVGLVIPDCAMVSHLGCLL